MKNQPDLKTIALLLKPKSVKLKLCWLGLICQTASIIIAILVVFLGKKA